MAEGRGLQWSHEPSPATRPRLHPGDLLVVNSGVRVDGELLESLAGGWVVTTTSGHDHIDQDAARAYGVTVARCPLARRDAVVDWTIGHMLALRYRWSEQWRASEAGTWARGQLPDLAPRGLCGARVVVVGCGVIGQALIARLSPYGADIVGVDPRGVPEGVDVGELEDVLGEADIVTLHCALNPTSSSLIDGAALERMRPDSIVLNSARGAALDVECAVDRVMSGQLGGLAVDVFPEEPWPHLSRSGRSGRVLYTPHAAGFTHDLGARVGEELARSLDAYRAGTEPPHRIA